MIIQHTPGPRREPREGFVAVGRVLGAHGTRGALRVESLSDAPGRFVPGGAVWLQGAKRVIASVSEARGRLILTLEGIDSREQAEAVRFELLEAPLSERPELHEGSYYHDQLLGMEVVDPEGRRLGELVNILETGANDVYVVQGPAGELLLPAIDDVVLDVDVANRRMVARPMEFD